MNIEVIYSCYDCIHCKRVSKGWKSLPNPCSTTSAFDKFKHYYFGKGSSDKSSYDLTPTVGL